MSNCDTISVPPGARRKVPRAFLFLKLALCVLLGVLAACFSLPAASTHAASLSTARTAASAPVTVYLDHRKLHDFNACPTRPVEDCSVIEYIDSGVYTSECQAQGEQVQDRGYTNDWWTKLQASDGRWGWITNIYIKGAAQIAGVPVCGAAPPPTQPNPTPAPPKPKSVSVLVFKEAETFPCIYPPLGRAAGCGSNGTIQPNNYPAYCQQQGGYYHEGGWTDRSNNWWTLIKNGNSLVWVSNLDIKGAAILEGVPQGPDACRANAPAGYPDGSYHP